MPEQPNTLPENAWKVYRHLTAWLLAYRKLPPITETAQATRLPVDTIKDNVQILLSRRYIHLDDRGRLCIWSRPLPPDYEL